MKILAGRFDARTAYSIRTLMGDSAPLEAVKAAIKRRWEEDIRRGYGCWLLKDDYEDYVNKCVDWVINYPYA